MSIVPRSIKQENVSNVHLVSISIIKENVSALTLFVDYLMKLMADVQNATLVTDLLIKENA